MKYEGVSMKNLHKLQGKREFLFDDRELIAIGVGALFICILIFVLGFLLGKDFQEKSVASPLISENMKVQEEAAPVERALPDTPVTEPVTPLVAEGQLHNEL